MALPKADPNVKAPAAVRAAAAAADRKHKEVYSKEPPEPTNEDPPAPAETPPAETQVTPEVTPPVQAAPEQKPAPTPPPTSDWEHKYNSMKGRFERADTSVRELSEQVSQLQNVISTMQAQQPVQPVPAPAPVVSLTPEEEAEYGSDFLDVIGRKAKATVSPEVEALKAELAAVKKQLEGVGGSIAQDARSRMIATLDQEVTDWRDTNNDENFLAWLRLPDTYSGAIRHELLKAAFARNDTPRVLAFFKGFRTEEAAVAPAAMLETPPAAPAPGKVPLADLAAPGRAKSPAATPAPAEKPIISRAQIAAFYADVAAGRYRGREEEKATNERMIFSAEREGRIRG